MIKQNIFNYFGLILACFIFGLAEEGLMSLSGIAGWAFIILTAGLLFYMGGNYVDQGYFHSNKWKVLFVVALPLIFLIDTLIIRSISWYSGSAGTAYYFLFTLRYVFKRLPRNQINQTNKHFSE